MKRGDSGFAWTIVGTVLLLAIVLLVWHFRSEETPSEQFAFNVKRLELVAQMRRDLASASEAEKSAVMAVTDRDSQQYADQARAAAAEVETGRVKLAELLQERGTQKEKTLLLQFSTVFSEFQRVDRDLLDLAVKNTNIKASALAFGPAAQALDEMDDALSRLIVRAADSKAANARTVMLMAAGAQAAALRIESLLPRHIAEESDEKMDSLEAKMTREGERAERNLKELDALLPGDKDLERSTTSYSRFTEMKKSILTLSRENTNVRSLSMSLNEKRKVMIMCQDALAALEGEIREEPIVAPVRPRG